MVKVKDILELMRVSQWYKNVVVFIPLIFSLNLFSVNIFLIFLLGFFALSFMSSSYYIINDLKDIEKDKHHPEKNKRPIVSGRVPKIMAVLICLLLFIDSLVISSYLSNEFFVFVIILFLSSQLYNFVLRGVAFFDIIIISINFVIRTLSGVFLSEISVSPWLILCAFFISIFLVSGKRISETNIKELKDYRKSLKKEHEHTLNLMAIISVASVIIFFCVYSIISDRLLLLITLPMSFYIILSYFNSVYNNPKQVRNPERFIFDRRNAIAIIFWVILLVIGLYFSV